MTEGSTCSASSNHQMEPWWNPRRPNDAAVRDFSAVTLLIDHLHLGSGHSDALGLEQRTSAAKIGQQKRVLQRRTAHVFPCLEDLGIQSQVPFTLLFGGGGIGPNSRPVQIRCWIPSTWSCAFFKACDLSPLKPPVAPCVPLEPWTSHGSRCYIWGHFGHPPAVQDVHTLGLEDLHTLGWDLETLRPWDLGASSKSPETLWWSLNVSMPM